MQYERSITVESPFAETVDRVRAALAKALQDNPAVQILDARRNDERARWPLERQVRLVAGALVLGSIATSLRAPWARFLAGGIGAGLTVSALTDTCTMGRVLSPLPYNRGHRDRNPADVLDQLPPPPDPA
jgi:hypothetical protein